MQAQASLVIPRATSEFLVVVAEISLATLGPDWDTSVSPKNVCANEGANFFFLTHSVLQVRVSRILQ